jgi:hypothetical protein
LKERRRLIRKAQYSFAFPFYFFDEGGYENAKCEDANGCNENGQRPKGKRRKNEQWAAGRPAEEPDAETKTDASGDREKS